MGKRRRIGLQSEGWERRKWLRLLEMRHAWKAETDVFISQTWLASNAFESIKNDVNHRVLKCSGDAIIHPHHSRPLRPHPPLPLVLRPLLDVLQWPRELAPPAVKLSLPVNILFNWLKLWMSSVCSNGTDQLVGASTSEKCRWSIPHLAKIVPGNTIVLAAEVSEVSSNVNYSVQEVEGEISRRVRVSIILCWGVRYFNISSYN